MKGPALITCMGLVSDKRISIAIIPFMYNNVMDLMVTWRHILFFPLLYMISHEAPASGQVV